MRFSTLAITTLVATTHPTQAQESPVAIEDYIHTDLNQLIYIPVLANDLTGHYTLPLSVRQVITNDVNGVDTSAQHGVCVLAPNHYGVLYEPDANYNGYDYCHYQVCDGRGPPFCDEAQITIHVGPHNESDSPTRKPTTSPTITSPSATTMPVAKNDSATLINNQQIIVNVLANDIRGDPDLPLSVRQIIANEPINTLHNALNGVCAVSPNRLSVIYTPNVGFVGTDSCQYEACDERGPSFCDVASITFTVAALAVTIEPTDVPTRKPTNLPTNIPTRNPTNKPTANPASVPVAINDFRTMTNTINASSLRINVLVNDVQGNPNFPLSVNSILTDADNDADSTNFPIALNGICAISQDHLAVLYTPNDGFDGIDRCAYRMCDSCGEAYCDEAVVQVTVDAPTPINKPTPRPTMSPTNFSAPSISNKPTRNPANPNSMPIAIKDSVTLDVNQVVRVAVLGNDILGDAAYAPLRVLRIVQNDFNALHNALNGLCTVSGNRLAVVYTPNAGFDGVDRCTYEMCDNRGEPCEYYILYCIFWCFIVFDILVLVFITMIMIMMIMCTHYY